MTRKLVAENWRLEQARYKMLGSHCSGCDGYHFPMKQLCLKCKTDENLKEYAFKGTGKLVEWTRIYEAARGFEGVAPYYYAIIELDEGIRVSTQLTSVFDETILEPGKPIKMVFRRLFQDGKEGLLTYGFKAEPVI